MSTMRCGKLDFNTCQNNLLKVFTSKWVNICMTHPFSKVELCWQFCRCWKLLECLSICEVKNGQHGFRKLKSQISDFNLGGCRAFFKAWHCFAGCALGFVVLPPALEGISRMWQVAVRYLTKLCVSISVLRFQGVGDSFQKKRRLAWQPGKDDIHKLEVVKSCCFKDKGNFIDQVAKPSHDPTLQS